MAVQHCGDIPDLVKTHNVGVFGIYPYEQGRLEALHETVELPHSRENRLIVKPRVWLFFDETDTIENDGLIRVNHHARGIQTGNRQELLMFINTMQEMGFTINESCEFVPCSNGQKVKYKGKPRRFATPITRDYPEDELRQLHTSRLPMDRLKLIESFRRYAPEEKQPELRAILNGTA
jgi:hypothetical protein